MLFFYLFLLIKLNSSQLFDETQSIKVVVKAEQSILNENAQNKIIIGQEEIKKSTAINLPELLNEFSDALITDLGSNSKNYNIDLYGFGETGSSNVLVLVNGIKLNEADISGVEWNLIPISNIERIEILKSAKNSVLYGDNASGGVINIITKEAKTFNTGASISGGTYNTLNSNMYFQKSFSNFSTGLFLNSSTTDGYRDNSHLNKTNLNYNLKFFKDNNFLLFETIYYKDKYGLPGSLFKSDLETSSRRATTKPDDNGESNTYLIRIKPELEILDDLIFSLDTNFREKTVFVEGIDADWGPFNFENNIETLNIKPEIKHTTNKNNFIIGADYTSAKSINNSMTRNVFDVYMYNKHQLTNKLLFDAGLRNSTANYYYPNAITRDKSVNAYTAGLTYKFNTDNFVYLNIAKTYRYALLDEYYNFFSNSTFDLKEQSSINYELGSFYKINSNLSANLDLFYKLTDDEIFYNPYLGIFGENSNLDGRTERLGSNISLNFSESIFNLNLFYSYIYNYIRSGEFKGSSIPGAPDHKAGFNFSIEPISNLILSFNGKYIGQRYFISDFNNSFSKQKEYFIVNSQIKYILNIYTFFINLNNITNQAYDYGIIGSNQKSYYPAAKFNVLCGVKLDLL